MGYVFNVTNISSNLNKHCLRMRSVWITAGITQPILIYRTPSIGIVFKIHKSLDQVIRMDIDIIPTPEVGARQETSVHNQLCDQAMDYEVWLTDHQYILTKLKRHRIWWGKKNPFRVTVTLTLTLEVLPSSHMLLTEIPPQVTPSTASGGVAQDTWPRVSPPLSIGWLLLLALAL